MLPARPPLPPRRQTGPSTETPAETLAADAREGGDGKKYAMLKVAAGMLGVGLDDLVRRDATRRARFAWTVAGASIAGMAATGALAVYAVAKGNEATAMRGRAETLVEFMLTELRDKLEPVGRIDILEAVGERAMKYYADQDLRTLNEDALARRAKALLLLGEIDFLRNDLDAAQTAYAAAVQATNEQLRRDPKNPTRIFDHAQAVFYNGETAVARGDLATAEDWYREYHRLAQELVKIDGTNPDYQLEIAYATSNLGSVKFFDGRYEEAIDEFKESIATRRRLFDAAPSDANIAFDYAYALSWRAFAELMRGSCDTAIDLIGQQLSIYGDQSSLESENFRVLDAAVTAHRRLAECHLAQGRADDARLAANNATAIADRLLRREKGNANWNVNASHIERMLSLLAKLDGDEPAAVSHAEKAIEYADAACARKTCEEWMRHARALAFARRIQSGDGSGAEDAAARLDAMLGELRGAESTDGASTLAAATLALERYRRRNGDLKTADALILASLPPIERRAEKIGALAKMSLAGLYLDAGDGDLARPIIDELRALSVRHPEFIALSAQFQAAAVD